MWLGKKPPLRMEHVYIMQVIFRSDGDSKRGNTLTLKGKGGKVRSLIIPEDLLDELKALKIGDYLFCVSTGKPLTRNRLHGIIKDLAVKAGINEHTSPHWLRHFHAVTAVKAGCPLHVLQQGLGHESLDTTKRYLHVIPGECSPLLCGFELDDSVKKF